MLCFLTFAVAALGASTVVAQTNSTGGVNVSSLPACALICAISSLSGSGAEPYLSPLFEGRTAAWLGIRRTSLRRARACPTARFDLQHWAGERRPPEDWASSDCRLVGLSAPFVEWFLDGYQRSRIILQCATANVTCVCTDSTYQLQFYNCQTKACNATDLQAALAFGAKTCAANGTPINTAVVPSGG
ncbi:BQ5605_C002g01725 [Microbotryum silenes-dioicae]|uniref:BQ5605_C002g01725 protein n=1 Tax=Microbotryum silenes-dioicae TaxID=796604 RepID=A0A2X0MLI7_9BASI|nr:BQ5605_C002g01725 [Microbotryum silenes-dioicae]